MPYADREKARAWATARRDRNRAAGLTGGGKERVQEPRNVYAEILELHEYGADAEQIAFDLGIKPASIHRTLLRHGRADLWPAMQRRRTVNTF